MEAPAILLYTNHNEHLLQIGCIKLLINTYYKLAVPLYYMLSQLYIQLSGTRIGNSLCFKIYIDSSLVSDTESLQTQFVLMNYAFSFYCV